MGSFAAVRAEHKMVSASTEGQLSKSPSTSLESCNLDACYNKFLSFYKLPLLDTPQTIFTFYQYLSLFDFSYPTTISIKNDYSEAYIYLPFESELLPDHQYASGHELLSIPLKSYTYTPAHSSASPNHSRFNTHFIAPKINECLSPGYQRPPSVPQVELPLYKPLNLGICTHNVRGYNTDLK